MPSIGFETVLRQQGESGDEEIGTRRYTVKPKAGPNQSPGYGQEVNPSNPEQGRRYWNPETGETREVQSEKEQDRYTRGAANFIKSPRLKALLGCVRDSMAGQSFEDRTESMEAMNDASKLCKNQLDRLGVPGGIPEEMEKTFQPGAEERD